MPKAMGYSGSRGRTAMTRKKNKRIIAEHNAMRPYKGKGQNVKQSIK